MVWMVQLMSIILKAVVLLAQAVPLLAKLRDLVRRRNIALSNSPADLPYKVLLVWASRNVEEFTALDLPLLSAIRSTFHHDLLAACCDCFSILPDQQKAKGEISSKVVWQSNGCHPASLAALHLHRRVLELAPSLSSLHLRLVLQIKV